jgi:hypothetical protein
MAKGYNQLKLISSSVNRCCSVGIEYCARISRCEASDGIGNSGPVSYAGQTFREFHILSRADRAEILVDYLGLSAKQLARALQHMIADGKYELAASLLESSGDRFAQSESVAKFKRLKSGKHSRKRLSGVDDARSCAH